MHDYHNNTPEIKGKNSLRTGYTVNRFQLFEFCGMYLFRYLEINLLQCD
jgi:hypothetical protein